MEFMFTSILTDDEGERDTLPMPAPDDESETLPTFDFPEARS
jgi:hypothetical protein